MSNAQGKLIWFFFLTEKHIRNAPYCLNNLNSDYKKGKPSNNLLFIVTQKVQKQIEPLPKARKQTMRRKLTIRTRWNPQAPQFDFFLTGRSVWWSVDCQQTAWLLLASSSCDAPLQCSSSVVQQRGQQQLSPVDSTRLDLRPTNRANKQQSASQLEQRRFEVWTFIVDVAVEERRKKNIHPTLHTSSNNAM